MTDGRETIQTDTMTSMASIRVETLVPRIPGIRELESRGPKIVISVPEIHPWGLDPIRTGMNTVGGTIRAEIHFYPSKVVAGVSMEDSLDVTMTLPVGKALTHKLLLIQSPQRHYVSRNMYPSAETGRDCVRLMETNSVPSVNNYDNLHQERATLCLHRRGSVMCLRVYCEFECGAEI